MNEFMTMVYVNLLLLGNRLKTGVQEFLNDEQGDVNIVSIVVLMGIAVLLAILFRGQIESLLTSLFSTISGNAESAVS